MNRTELTKLNVGYNLDWLMNLDPRGYGVCRILYDGAIKYTGKPLSLNGAEGLVANIKKGEKVFILTGFVLLPWNEAETDGIISSTVFARFVMRAFGAKPVMIVPDQCEISIKAMSEVLGVQSIVIPERPVKAGSTEMGKVENDDLITFLVKYENGAIGDFSSSRVATGRKNYFYYEIQGTEGSVVYDLERMCEVQVYFKADADKDNGRDCGFRTVLLNPQHEGFKYFQPAGGIAIAFDDMKTLQAHALMQAMHGGEYICDFEMGAKVDGIINAVLKSVKSGTWEKC